ERDRERERDVFNPHINTGTHPVILFLIKTQQSPLMQGYREIHKDKTLLCLALSPSLCFILSLSSLSLCFFPSLRAITVEVFNTHSHTHTLTHTHTHTFRHTLIA